MLQGDDSSPHDGTRYMMALRRRVPDPDAIAMSYMEEGIAAWRAGLHRSCVVMVGCACERLILLLAEGVAAASVAPYSADLSKMLASSKPTGISQVFDKVHGALSAAGDDRRVPGDLADAFDRRLTPMFERHVGCAIGRVTPRALTCLPKRLKQASCFSPTTASTHRTGSPR